MHHKLFAIIRDTPTQPAQRNPTPIWPVTMYENTPEASTSSAGPNVFALARALGVHFLALRGSGFIFTSRPISLSAAERFSSASISRAFSIKALDCSGSSRDVLCGRAVFIFLAFFDVSQQRRRAFTCIRFFDTKPLARFCIYSIVQIQ